MMFIFRKSPTETRFVKFSSRLFTCDLGQTKSQEQITQNVQKI